MPYRISLAKWCDLENCLRAKGVIYHFSPGRNDGFIYKQSDPDGLAKFHIHSIEHVDGDNQIFDNLLAKNSNERTGDEPDLAGMELDAWDGAVTGMNSSVKAAVRALRECLENLGASRI